MFTRWYDAARSWLRREDGQAMVEYALIIALVAVILVGALTALETGIAGTFGDIVAKL